MAYVVDVVGLENILQRFEMYGCTAFSVWQGKQLKFVCDDLDDINQASTFLSMNLQGLNPLSTALYEIRLYKDVPDKGINEKTPIRGSFTFKMNSGLSESTVGNYGTGSSELVKFLKEKNFALEQRLELLEQKNVAGIGTLQTEDDEDPQIKKISGIVDLIDSSPFLQKTAGDFMNIIKNLFGSAAAPAADHTVQQHAIAGIDIDPNLPPQKKIEEVIATMINAETEQQALQKLNVLSESLRLLIQRDPDFINTLHKLSLMDNGKYSMAKNFL